MVPYSNRTRNKAQVNLGGNDFISYLPKERNINAIFTELVWPGSGSPAAHGRELQLHRYNPQQKPPENALKWEFRRMWTIWTVSTWQFFPAGALRQSSLVLLPESYRARWPRMARIISGALSLYFYWFMEQISVIWCHDKWQQMQQPCWKSLRPP